MSPDQCKVKVLEQCGIAPPPGSLPSIVLPLSFFDYLWLPCFPMQRLFFYQFQENHHDHQYFIQTILPSLKNSLSISLQHFFPFASSLVCPTKPGKPYLLYTDGDSVPFTVTESTDDFNHLTANCARDVQEFHPFAPELTTSACVMAIQLTIISGSGFCVGITFRHVVADGRAFHHFMKFWASLCKTGGGDIALIQVPLPLHNRAEIEDPNELGLNFLNSWWNWGAQWAEKGLPDDVLVHKDRTTVVLSPAHVKKLKNWVSRSVGKEHVSTFVVTSALIWFCLSKTEESMKNNEPSNCEELSYFCFIADCRNRSGFSISLEYFGNCLAVCFVQLKRGELFGENGIGKAVKAIGNKVRELESAALRGAERWLSDWKEIIEMGVHVVSVAGSTKFGVYDTDFGWGRPKKTEVLHIDISGSISLAESRDGEGGLEVGLALQRDKMDRFNAIFQECLQLAN